MIRIITISLFLISAHLVAQTNIDISNFGVNKIDEKGNKQGMWKLYQNDSLVMSCEYKDNQIQDTIVYYNSSRIVMHYIPKDEKSLWFFYSTDTLSGYSDYNDDNHFRYYYLNGNQIEKEMMFKISDVSEFKSAYYGGAEKTQNDLIKNYDNSISSGRYKVSFVIDKNGFVTNIKVEESPNKKMNKKIKRMVEGLERWQPAHQRGKMVRMSYSIPIKL